jgi:uncharacterized protein (TIGR03083 family)
VDAESYWLTVAGLRRRIADELESLSPDEWDAPSLCAGWRVRDVAGHLSLVPTVTLREMLAVAPRCAFDPNRINTALAVRYGSQEPSTVVARIREHADNRTTARGLDTANSLFDLVVHSQDVAVPLGRRLEVPPETSVAGLQRVWEMGWPFRARRRFGHVALTATDADWSAGQGPEVRGPALALLLLLTGRGSSAARDLSGAGATLLGV